MDLSFCNVFFQLFFHFDITFVFTIYSSCSFQVKDAWADGLSGWRPSSAKLRDCLAHLVESWLFLKVSGHPKSVRLRPVWWPFGFEAILRSRNPLCVNPVRGCLV